MQTQITVMGKCACTQAMFVVEYLAFDSGK